PAILLAAETHRQGNLHIQRESKWDPASEIGGSFTQGFAIDNKFRAKLPPYLNRLQFKDSSDYQAQVADTHSPETIAADICAAAQQTYRWMYGEVMGPALREALPRNELAYYRGLAARDDANVADKGTGDLKPAFNLTAGELIAIASEAERRNKAGMSKFNWVL